MAASSLEAELAKDIPQAYLAGGRQGEAGQRKGERGDSIATGHLTREGLVGVYGTRPIRVREATSSTASRHWALIRRCSSGD